MINESNEEKKIKIRYIVLHGIERFRSIWERVLLESLSYYIPNVTNLSEFLEIQISTIRIDSGKFLSRISMVLSPDVTPQAISQFEENIRSEDNIFDIVKVFDFYKLTENKRFLEYLFEIEMKVREIYTILLYHLGKNVEESEVKIVKEFKNNSEEYKKRLMNELFFIEFSDYKKVDLRRKVRIEEILFILQNVKTFEDMNLAISELTKGTLGLKEQFPQLLELEKIIGRLERSRNSIAHNRYLSEKDIENLKKASEMIDSIYNELLDHIFSPQ